LDSGKAEDQKQPPLEVGWYDIGRGGDSLLDMGQHLLSSLPFPSPSFLPGVWGAL